MKAGVSLKMLWKEYVDQCKSTHIHIELNKLKNKEFQKREGARKSVYMDEEKDFMNPLTENPFELSEWKMATVQLNYHIQVEKMNYSIPYEYVGKRVEVKQKTQSLFIIKSSSFANRW